MAGSHQSLTQETLRTPSVSAYPVLEGESMQICIVQEGGHKDDTLQALSSRWVTSIGARGS